MPRDEYLDAVTATARALARRGHPHPRHVVLAELAALVARSLDVDTTGLPLDRWRDSAGALPTPPAPSPELLGEAFEMLVDAQTRRRVGAIFTPRSVAGSVVDEALGLVAAESEPVAVCDPAAGGGAFLLAAARWQIGNGASPDGVVRGLHGLDIDPLAVEVAETSLRLLGRSHGVESRPTLSVGDALTTDSWEGAVPGGYHAVVGNPPFLNQLAADTVRDAARRLELRARYGALAGGYADTAFLFLQLALDIAREGGAIALVLPESFLAGRDARRARAIVATRGRLRWIWRSVDRVFAADVRVVAPIVTLGAQEPGPVKVRRSAGADVVDLAPIDVDPEELAASATWSWLFADLAGTPTFELIGSSTLGDHCRATADFRDQYYGLRPFVYDDVDGVAGGGGGGGGGGATRSAPLVTVGLIDPACCAWGWRPVRFAKATLARPRVDLDAMGREPKLSAWATSRLVPKVLLATQSRVLEPVVDESGDWLPSTPVITVEADPDRLWHVAAALASPVLTAWAVRHHSGAALSPHAIKLSARQVMALPAPRPGPAWDEGAGAFRAAQQAAGGEERLDLLTGGARAMGRAYGLPADGNDGLVAWWLARLSARPLRRGRR